MSVSPSGFMRSLGCREPRALRPTSYRPSGPGIVFGLWIVFRGAVTPRLCEDLVDDADFFVVGADEALVEAVVVVGEGEGVEAKQMQ